MTGDLAASLDHLRLLGTLQDDFRTTIPSVDPGARVPWCGRWRVRDLVVHLARIHHWAAAQAARRRESPLGHGPFDLVELYTTCAAELRDTLATLGPDAPASTLLGPGRASFWHRRQVHETLVHLWDLRTAGGLTLDVGAAVWADTVDEVVTVMQPRQVRMGRMEPLPAAIALHAADADRTWLLGAPTPADPATPGARAPRTVPVAADPRAPATAAADPRASATVAADSRAPATAAADSRAPATAAADMRASASVAVAADVHGDARDLALLVWGRPVGDLRVEGDRAALDDALARRLTP